MKKKILALLMASLILVAGCGKEIVSNPSVQTEVIEKNQEEVVEQETTSEEITTEEVKAERKDFAWLDESKTIEERVELLLSEMTLEEKAYQMIQPEQAEISKEEITKYGVGSVLSGGGSAPKIGNSAQMWNKYVNSLKDAAMETRLQIPLLYGVDAVHGHNNVNGATVFPHNIGLGAANDEELMYEIARITALEVKATGIQWDFSPCLGNPQDVTWGRTYECFSDKTEDIVRLTDDYIKGLQDNGVLACAKHFIGEGYTTDGVNQGNVDMTPEEFDELLRAGVLDPYTSAINAGVLTVMPSYNSIDGVKCHANYHLLTEILKEELGFKGFVISDYNAIDQIQASGLKEQVCISINAGVDMLMEPQMWRESGQYIIELVNEGKITEERLNDAVSRILYVKFVAGLFEEIDYEEEQRLLAEFGSDEHRAVARRAVKESLVVMKDDNNTLQNLKNAKYITIEGMAGNNIGRQCGGWTITWQGKSGKITQGTTIFEAIKNERKDEATVKYKIDGSYDEETDAIIAVFGEGPYAEYAGDRDGVVLMEEVDAKMLDSLRENLKASNDVPVIAIIVAGRPIEMSEYEDMFDAVIMAWLPGTEGAGVADFLFE